MLVRSCFLLVGWALCLGSAQANDAPRALRDYSYARPLSYFRPLIQTTVNVVQDFYSGVPTVFGDSTDEWIVVSSHLDRKIFVIDSQGKTRCDVNVSPGYGPVSLVRTNLDQVVYGVLDKIFLLRISSCTVSLVGRPAPGRYVSAVSGMVSGDYIVAFEAKPGEPVALDCPRHRSSPSIRRKLPERWGLARWSPTDNAVKWSRDINCFPSARSVRVVKGQAVVANTFRHAVEIVDVETGVSKQTYSSFYPSGVQSFGDSALLASEEHLNRVVVLQASGRKRTFFACNHSVFWDTRVPRGRLLALKELPVLEDKIDNPEGRSICAIENSGRYTLYSPGGLAVARDGTYIADSDNHRVIKISPAKIISREIRGLNNPMAVEVMFAPTSTQ